MFGSELEATRITGGVQGDICDPSYDKTITDVSLAAARLSDTFFLSEEPNVDTLLVEVGGVEQPCAEGTWSFTHKNKEGEEAMEKAAVVGGATAVMELALVVERAVTERKAVVETGVVMGKAVMMAVLRAEAMEAAAVAVIAVEKMETAMVVVMV